MVSEKSVEQYLKTNIERLGGKCLKFVSPGMNGVPDRICVMPKGRQFYVEVKKPGEKPTKLQQKIHRDFRDLGHMVSVVDSKAAVNLLIEDWSELYGD